MDKITTLLLIITITTTTITTYELLKKTQTKYAPSDYLNEEKILTGYKEEGLWKYSEYYILIPLNQEPRISKFTNTGSMKPTLDENSNAIEITPTNENEIHIGDIISYRNNETIIIHRVINIKNDTEGWYAETKGDNNPSKDNNKIRFEQITGKVIAIIY